MADQKVESTDSQQEAADLAQAQGVCGLTTTPPSTPADPSSCAAALAKVGTDEQAVANDQQTVATDETNLAQALTAEQAQSQSSSSTPTTSPSGTAGSSSAQTSAPNSTSGASSSTGSSSRALGSTSATNSAQQIASDQSAIDTAQSNLIEAQQSLGAAQLTSPIDGTVASIGFATGDSVTAHSSTQDIVIIGTDSYEVTATLSSTQVASVKVGYPASVSVDGTTGTLLGSVTQVGPVQAASSGYTYPIVVILPSSATGLFAGSTANVSILTKSATSVLAVPTSAVSTVGTRTFVETVNGGTVTRKAVKVGIVGGVHTQVRSGLSLGDTVVLANLSAPVPTSSSSSTSGFGGGGFSGGFGSGLGSSGGLGGAGFSPGARGG